MVEGTATALDNMKPEVISELFRLTGLRVRGRRVASPTGPRWAIWLHASDVDLWVEAADWAEAWHKAAAYAQEVGLLK